MLCPLRYVAILGSIIFLIVLFNFKLTFTYPTLNSIEKIIFFNIGAFLTLNLYLLSFFLVFFIFELKKELQYSVKYYLKKFLIILYSFILMTEHILMIFVMIYTNFGNRMVIILIIEITLPSMCFLSVKLYKCCKYKNQTHYYLDMEQIKLK